MQVKDVVKHTKGTQSSQVVDACQVCQSKQLKNILFLGYLPPVNQMRDIGAKPHEEAAYPAQLLHCPECHLVQIGLIVDPEILFPPEYPYTSGTTRILRENFSELQREVTELYPLDINNDLVVDVGSNDGTLLSNFKNAGFKVLGIEPTLMANLANERGIRSMMSFFGPESAQKAVEQFGKAKIITATNVFAHIEDIHAIVKSVLHLLDDNGIFINESHYLLSLIETLQYDTIYHEHLRYYSLTSLKYLFEQHGLEIIHAKRIPTHGGSIRVYASRKGQYDVRQTVKDILNEEEDAGLHTQMLSSFGKKTSQTKLNLYELLSQIKSKGQTIYGIGAPSRASTLIHYVGLDDQVLNCVLEIKGSYKIGKYMPGTLIPVEEEGRLFLDQPDYALLLSWHIADELIPKLREKGFKGKFIVPLPEPRIVD